MDLVFENSTYCNQSCYFCPQYKFKMRDRIMDTELFKNIIDILASNVSVSCVNFSGMGEPLIDPDLIGKIKYANKYTKHVTFYTNGRLLSRNILMACKSFVSQIFISVHGDTIEEYEHYSGYQFDKILSTINMARDVLQDPHGKKLVVINHPHGKMSHLLGPVTVPHPIHNWGDAEIEQRTGSTMQGCKYECSFRAYKIRIDGSVSLCGQDWDMQNDFLNGAFPACDHCQHKNALLALRNNKKEWDNFIAIIQKINALVI